MPHMKQPGFTLIEVLVVLVIVGILISIVLANSLGAQRNAQVRDAATQLAADLSRARGLALRTSKDAALTLCASATACTTAPSGQTAAYQLTSSEGTAVKTLPSNVKVAVYGSSPSTITYTAPNAEVSSAASGIVWTVSSAVASKPLYLKAVGLTGKVIVSADHN